MEYTVGMKGITWLLRIIDTMELWSELFGTRHEPKQLSVN